MTQRMSRHEWGTSCQVASVQRLQFGGAQPDQWQPGARSRLIWVPQLLAAVRVPPQRATPSVAEYCAAGWAELGGDG